jgi:hypothetical protein
VRRSRTHRSLRTPVIVRFPIVDGPGDAGREVQVGQAVVERLAAIVVVVGLRRIRVTPPWNQQKINRNGKDDK